MQQSITYVRNSMGQAIEPRSLKRSELSGLSILNEDGGVNTQGLGYQVAIDTLTYIKKTPTVQKFYREDPYKYIPIEVGDGAFAQNILTNREYSLSGEFEEGLINTGAQGDRLSTSDVAIDTKTIKVNNWAKQIEYSIFDIEQALQANNWDVILGKHRARERNWKLGLQKTAFLGLKADPTGTPGLLTNPDVTVNNTFFTKKISEMTAAEFNTMVQSIISTYFTNTAYTQMPTTFVIPYSEWLAMVGMVQNVVDMGGANTGTAGFPVTKLDWLQYAWRKATGNESFEILPLAYAEAAQNAAYGLNKDVYMLYNKDRETLRMDIPVWYTVTQPNSLNNFQFQDVAFGQFTGTGVYRGSEVIRFEVTPSTGD